MFFPDKVRGNAEARRVLRDGGRYMLVIWDKVERNLATKVAGRRGGRTVSRRGRRLLRALPFRYHEQAWIERDLSAAGFTEIEFETVELRSRAASARDAAIAPDQGTPMRSEIEARGAGMLQRATDAAAEAAAAVRRAGRLRCADVGAHRDRD